MKNIYQYIFVLGLLVLFPAVAKSQLSPGELTTAHQNLEGLSNCTKCHVLGEKETTSKCLECHKEIQNLINRKKGYHASEEVEGNDCGNCHGEHYGRDFEIVPFDEEFFEHVIAGFKLEGKHSEIKCADCHKPELIKNKISQKKGTTFLGLDTDCLSCHKDFHQKTLSSDCLSCHNQKAFRPAEKFNHDNSKFKLAGAHKKVKCSLCHKTEEKNNRQFQKFTGLTYSKCNNCHTDVHKNKFGTDCLKCHTVFSFKQDGNLDGFNHDITNFSLRGKHQLLDCKSCHKGSYTNPLKHENCFDCHIDYHEQQFVSNGIATDCSECHSNDGFKTTSFTFEKHSKTNFRLEGPHLATPCFTCHKKTEKWNFRIKYACIDCHNNIHENFINEEYMPNNNCLVCHSASVWNEVTFNHELTEFKLEGKHKTVSCRQCHFTEQTDGTVVQNFDKQETTCRSCHADNHNNQFQTNEITTCENCHTVDNWVPEKFNHNNARFKLDGKHINVECAKCHKSKDGLEKNYFVYKFEDISCASCHS